MGLMVAGRLLIAAGMTAAFLFFLKLSLLLAAPIVALCLGLELLVMNQCLKGLKKLGIAISCSLLLALAIRLTLEALSPLLSPLATPYFNLLSLVVGCYLTPLLMRRMTFEKLAAEAAPLESGQHLSIKIQRIGKEPDQGVGYLEDGTMVVVNGGSHFLGKTVDSSVLSTRQTPNGRMIFCNLLA